MSCRKYVLKKDLKTIVVKFHGKLPIISSSPTPSPKLNLVLSKLPTAAKLEKARKSLKIINNLSSYKSSENKKRAKSYIRKNPFDTTFMNTSPKCFINSNIRYLQEISEEIEDQNTILTPNHTKNLHNITTLCISLQTLQLFPSPQEALSSFGL